MSITRETITMPNATASVATPAPWRSTHIRWMPLTAVGLGTTAQYLIEMLTTDVAGLTSVAAGAALMRTAAIDSWRRIVP